MYHYGIGKCISDIIIKPWDMLQDMIESSSCIVRYQRVTIGLKSVLMNIGFLCYIWIVNILSLNWKPSTSALYFVLYTSFCVIKVDSSSKTWRFNLPWERIFIINQAENMCAALVWKAHFIRPLPIKFRIS